jgi:tRNA uridine 5-carbamoylmethylation protein Kti12
VWVAWFAMPCLIITGHPSAGKTTLAHLFAERARARNLACLIINEASTSPGRTQAACYATSYDEKKSRGALKAAFDRAVAASRETNTLVILDSLNYIKGFRYELYCISKAVGERHGVIWVLNDVSLVQQWNALRRQSSADSEAFYSDALLQELMQRYEPPDSRNRWDQPLYRVDVRPAELRKTGLALNLLEKSVYNMHQLSDAICRSEEAVVEKKPVKKSTFKRATFTRINNSSHPGTEDKGEAVPENLDETSVCTVPPTKSGSNDETIVEGLHRVLTLEERVDEILDSFLSEKPLLEGMSTKQHPASDANTLNNVDSVSQEICTLISAAQNKSTSAGGKLPIPIYGTTLYFQCARRIPPTEIKRLRRQYIQWIAGHPPEDSSERGIAQSFLDYIQAQR